MRTQATRYTLLPVVLLVVIAAVGCAPAIYVPLKAEHSAKIRATRVDAAVPQEAIDGTFKRSNLVAAGGGGLLLAMIDAGVDARRRSVAASLVEPIQKEAPDFDFRALFFESLKNTVDDLTAIKAQHVATGAKPLSPSEGPTLLREVPEDAVLSVQTVYQLSPDFRMLWVRTTTALLMRDQKETAYRAQYWYVTPPIASAKGREEAAKAWAANRAAALRAAMREGIGETMKMLRLDLGVPVVPTASGTPALATPDGRQTFPSYLAKNANRYIVRYGNGFMYSASSEESFTAPAGPR